MAAYSMGKAAINHFTLILAADLGKRGITANTIAPCLIATDFTAHTWQTPHVVQQISSHIALGRIEDILWQPFEHLGSEKNSFLTKKAASTEANKPTATKSTKPQAKKSRNLARSKRQ